MYPNSALMPAAHRSAQMRMRRGCMPPPMEATSTSVSVSRIVPPAWRGEWRGGVGGREGKGEGKRTRVE